VKDKVKDGKYDISRALNELVDGRILRLTYVKEVITYYLIFVILLNEAKM
jgi:hypothetical protein